jgi:hypothetical protein
MGGKMSDKDRKKLLRSGGEDITEGNAEASASGNLRDTIRSSWAKTRKKAKSKNVKDFDPSKKAKVSKGGYRK